MQKRNYAEDKEEKMKRSTLAIMTAAAMSMMSLTAFASNADMLAGELE